MSGELTPDRRNLRVSHEERDQVVARLQTAAGDGRLTAEELDERVGSALTARTFGDLEALVSDLPAVPGGAPALAPIPAVRIKDSIRLQATHGVIRRDGSWTVPRQLTVDVRHGHVFIDFTEAVISQPTLDLPVSLVHGNMVLTVPAGVTVDMDSITATHSNIRNRAFPEPGAPVRLLVSVSGKVRHSNVTVRGPRAPRRGFWAWLFRRPRPAARALPSAIQAPLYRTVPGDRISAFNVGAAPMPHLFHEGQQRTAVTRERVLDRRGRDASWRAVHDLVLGELAELLGEHLGRYVRHQPPQAGEMPR